MDDEILTIYCLCNDYLKRMHHQDDPQTRMSSAEVMIVASIIAVRHFSGNFKTARDWLPQPMWMPHMLSKSCFSRRLHSISSHFEALFELLAMVWKADNNYQLYHVDTFPIPVCDNSRIKHCRLHQTEAYRGYKTSQRRYFYSLRLHLVTTDTGQPVEFMLSAGSVGDVTGLRGFDFDLPEGATIIGDKAYNLYWFEELLADSDLTLLPIRKKTANGRLKVGSGGCNIYVVSQLRRQTV